MRKVLADNVEKPDGRLPSSLTGIVGELMVIAGEVAPEHGRSTYSGRDVEK